MPEYITEAKEKVRMALQEIAKTLKEKFGDVGDGNFIITFSSALACFDEDGELTLDEALSQQLQKVNIAREIEKIDEAASVCKIFDAASPEQTSLSEITNNMNFLSQSLSAFIAAAKLVNHKKNCGTEPMNEDQETTYLRLFEEFATELSQTDPANSLAGHLIQFKTAQTEMLSSLQRGCMTRLNSLKSELRGKLLDIKALCKDLDSNLNKFINYEGRSAFVENLKMLQGTTGLRRFIRLREALECCDITTLDGVKLRTYGGELNELRQKCRLQVCCRSAAVIISKGRPQEVDDFNGECRSLKVTIPKELKQKLADLK